MPSAARGSISYAWQRTKKTSVSFRAHFISHTIVAYAMGAQRGRGLSRSVTYDPEMLYALHHMKKTYTYPLHGYYPSV